MKASRFENLTRVQAQCLVRVILATEAGGWYRGGMTSAQTSGGERVTLSSLHTRGLLLRRYRADDPHAYEYAALPEAVDAWKSLTRTNVSS